MQSGRALRGFAFTKCLAGVRAVHTTRPHAGPVSARSMSPRGCGVAAVRRCQVDRPLCAQDGPGFATELSPAPFQRSQRCCTGHSNERTAQRCCARLLHQQVRWSTPASCHPPCCGLVSGRWAGLSGGPGKTCPPPLQPSSRQPHRIAWMLLYPALAPVNGCDVMNATTTSSPSSRHSNMRLLQQVLGSAIRVVSSSTACARARNAVRRATVSNFLMIFAPCPITVDACVLPAASRASWSWRHGSR
jgi:hypothetical protein